MRKLQFRLGLWLLSNFILPRWLARIAFWLVRD